MKWKLVVAQVIAVLFVLLWLYAASSKLIDFEKFQVTLGKSPVTEPFAKIVAWIVPAIEILLSVLLMIDRSRQFALYASFTLMVMFTAYIVVITHFADNVPCSCGGILEKMTWNDHLVFNIVFVVLGACAALVNYYPDKKELLQ